MAELVEGARLEIVFGVTTNEGSNPSSSAIENGVACTFPQRATPCYNLLVRRGRIVVECLGLENR